jgi:endonuclease G
LKQRLLWVSSRALIAVAIVVLTLGTVRPADATNHPFAACLDEFWRGQPPALTAEGPLFALCARHFGTLYSGATETPLYSAEHLTNQQIKAAIRMPRDNGFHQDRRLPYAIASTLGDYRGSGYDRGHMAPSGDEPDSVSQFQSFVLSNMVPQNSDDNRHLWADIETAVRELVLASGDDVYVITGPMFSGSEPMPLNGQVWVPASLFKAVYDPKAGIAGVYVARNAPGRRYWLLSVADFTARFGLNPFPELPEKIMMVVGNLLTPAFERYPEHGEAVQ